MGQKIFLTGANITDTKFPILMDDEELNAGSLLLVDFTHSLTAITGVPAAGSKVRNLARAQAAALIGGVTDLTTLDVTFNNTLTSAEAIFERTPKGALHGIVSQVSQVSGHSASVRAPDLIGQYRINNPTHLYGLSIRRNITRVSKSTNTNVMDVFAANATSSSSAAANYLFLLRGSQAQTLGMQQSAQTATYTGTPATDASKEVTVGGWGSVATYNTLGYNNAGSYVLYRLYLEDLTASGRSAADFQASSLAYYNKQVADGGRWYGDTIPTSPSTLP